MATTTATVSISSNDLTPGSNLSINASSTLMKTGLTTGMELVEMGNAELAADYEAQLFADGPATDNGAYWVYICNTSTDESYYTEVKIHETRIGLLQAGDWMWMPWNMGDAVAELNIEAEPTGATIPYEYAIFKSTYTLPASTP